MAEPILSAADEPRARRPVLGYTMVLAATAMRGINGTVSKGILGAGLSAPRLTEVRSTGAALSLGAALLLTQPWRLRVRRGELLFVLVFGIIGLALVQWLYFFSIYRLEIGIALFIQYLAPVLIALWARYVI
jgi:drug/metabolite transporter (DMT)-like permease